MHIGIIILLLHVEGVRQGHGRIGHEEVFVRDCGGGEVLQRTLAAEASIAEVYQILESTFTPIGWMAVGGGSDTESQRVVPLHFQRLFDVGEYPCRGQGAEEFETVRLEVRELFDDKGVQ